jgi:molecular chaperone Hsp33
MDQSRLFTFMDKNNSYNVYFLYGEKLMQDIYKIHNIGPVASKFYDKTILTSLHMINFTKIDENLGYYIDSEEPYFRFKIEMNHQGTMRTLLLPEEFDSFPEKLTGKARVTISYPNKQPYSSLIELSKTKTDDVFTQMINTSYQVKSDTILGNKSSALLRPLPASNIDEKFDEIKTSTIESIHKEVGSFLKEVVTKQFKTEEECIDLFSKNGFNYLGSKEVKFHCPCSKERMVTNLLTLPQDDQKEIFKDGKIEIRCDYCNSVYVIEESDIENKVQ